MFKSEQNKKKLLTNFISSSFNDFTVVIHMSRDCGVLKIESDVFHNLLLFFRFFNLINGLNFEKC